MEFRPLGRTHESIPVVGLGTWGIGGEMGPDSSGDEVGVQALRLGLVLEMKFIDTSEMYGVCDSVDAVGGALGGGYEWFLVVSKAFTRYLAFDEWLAEA